MFHLLGPNSFHKAPLRRALPPRSLLNWAERRAPRGAADGQLCETSLQAQCLEMLHPATAEAEISHEIFGLPVNMHDGLVSASILATASPSIGGDTAAILLAGLSANIWKSELQTVTNDTGVARSTLCIATKKKGMNECDSRTSCACQPAHVPQAPAVGFNRDLQGGKAKLGGGAPELRVTTSQFRSPIRGPART